MSKSPNTPPARLLMGVTMGEFTLKDADGNTLISLTKETVYHREHGEDKPVRTQLVEYISDRVNLMPLLTQSTKGEVK
jgi:hypothetical protein